MHMYNMFVTELNCGYLNVQILSLAGYGILFIQTESTSCKFYVAIAISAAISQLYVCYLSCMFVYLVLTTYIAMHTYHSLVAKTMN